MKISFLPQFSAFAGILHVLSKKRVLKAQNDNFSVKCKVALLRLLWIQPLAVIHRSADPAVRQRLRILSTFSVDNFVANSVSDKRSQGL